MNEKTALDQRVVEAVARAMFERRNRGIRNCYDWDDFGLDSEHPGVREELEADARAAITSHIASLRGDAGELVERLHARAKLIGTGNRPTQFLMNEAATALALLDEPWQDIASAKKNGTRYLLAKIIGNPLNYPDDPTKVIWWACIGCWSNQWHNWNDGIEPSGLAGPTHYLPLNFAGVPTPPPAQEGESCRNM